MAYQSRYIRERGIPEKTCFVADDRRLGGRQPRFTLGSPNFRRCNPAQHEADHDTDGVEGRDEEMEPVAELVPTESAEADPGEMPPMPPDAEGYDLALLRFFRDLLENERLRILVTFDAIPSDSDERMTLGVERKLFDWLAREGRLPDVVMMIDKLIAERGKGEA